MKIKPENCNGNGNFETNYRDTIITSYEICNNQRDLEKINHTQHFNKNKINKYIRNCNYNKTTNKVKEIADNITSLKSKDTIKNKQDFTDINCKAIVCNKQYKLNATNANSITNQNVGTDTITLDNSEKIDNVTTSSLYIKKKLEFIDADEMSGTNVHNIPRGIVNPNYPGFQHLAHTLQDYSSNIEQFDHSENDMTDDDIEIDINESHNKINTQEKEYVNGNNVDMDPVKETIIGNDLFSHSTYDSENQIPDLLKTISKNNNNDILINCTTTDIENNFHTKDIIGDFNKEVEDEIKSLLNYNINIEEDLQELRKDIKETFAKPIENTINNISDVVNDVIKKLVENDVCDKNETLAADETVHENIIEEDTIMQEENENNMRTERNITRPSFLLIDNTESSTITDAILSDGKEEINIQEYNAEHLSHNVENTIKQLSTELRKIIPKLNEMRERDKIWSENKKTVPISRDGNSNNIFQASNDSKRNCRLNLFHGNSRRNTQDNIVGVSQKGGKLRNESRVRQSLSKSMLKVENSLSVRRQEYDKDIEYESFDVYNIETALPKLDLDAIEHHITAAKEAERKKRNDREEIRKRLAMDVETEDYYSLGHIDRPGKKPSLHSRLQNGKNLQICFMNEIASDNESQSSDVEKTLNSNSSSRTSLLSRDIYNHPYQTRPLSVNITKHDKAVNAKNGNKNGSKLRPTSLSLKTSKSRSSQSLNQFDIKESDFFALQATLQTEARIALAQAKEMARLQMEHERRSRGTSPVTQMLRRSVEKARVPLDPPRRRLSRHLLTDVNVTQLQVIVNELHSQIEALNDTLVKLLMARDELHMGQDSMLVDIEDLTRYLGVKEQTKKTKGTAAKSGVRRLTSLVHK